MRILCETTLVYADIYFILSLLVTWTPYTYSYLYHEPPRTFAPQQRNPTQMGTIEYFKSSKPYYLSVYCILRAGLVKILSAALVKIYYTMSVLFKTL